MLFRRLFNEQLAQASYLIGCQESGTAIVVDPLRDTDRYLAAADAEKVQITDVTETHIHADFVSGAHDLSIATGARLHLSAMGGKDWQYKLSPGSNVNLLTDGSSILIGNVRIETVHTPGHTPEHLSFLVTDILGANAPIGALTGDFIFVGDVGRPDLLETAAGFAGTKEAGASDLFKSLQEFKKRPDYLQIWPGHGAGSACGKSLGSMPQSTLGYERLFNWGLAETDEAAFVRNVLTGQPDPPAYFAIMKQMNRTIPPPRTSVPVPRIAAVDLAAHIQGGATVVDTRSTSEFAGRHAAGTINIPWSDSFLKYSGQLLPYDRSIYLITAGTRDEGRAMVNNLALIGIDRVGGIHHLTSFDAFESAGVMTRSIPQIRIPALGNGERQDFTIIDVRAKDEWNEGHIPGAIHIPLGSLERRLSEIPREKHIAVHCQGGTRSAIAASILAKNNIVAANVAGGFEEWERSGKLVERTDRSGS